MAASCIMLCLAFAGMSTAQVMARPGWVGSGVTVDPWWKHAVIYQIYPRSFQDSNGDGIGDINGIISRLDYLQSLGVDAIWLNPIYPSPQVDFGYDISDYEAIDPQYGTMDDFDHLVEEAGHHNIRIIMDLVLNHTSDQHPWFIESASSKDNPKKDWYVWANGDNGADGKNTAPPNNWQSLFGHSAWQYNATRDQFYYHKFYPQQPDLNWRNPAVRKAMYDVVRFWLNRGVAGFRLDAITNLFENASLKDETILPGTNNFGDPNQDTSLTDNLPEVHDVLRELRKVSDGYPGHRVLIGETYLQSAQDLARMYGRNHDELQLPMDTQVGFIDKLDVTAFRQKLEEAETQIGDNQPLLLFDNHDNPRSWDRYGDGVHNAEIARVVATIELATRATAIIYYGQELGMVTTPPARKEDVKDPIGVIGWPNEKGRDGERTPMQWIKPTKAAPNAGFTIGKPWLPVPANAAKINVQAENGDPTSLLEWYRKLIQLRQNNVTLREGTNTMLNHDADDVLVWLRKPPASSANGANANPVLVFCNFSDETRTISVVDDLKKNQVRGYYMHTLLHSGDSFGPVELSAVKLPPFGVYIGEVERDVVH
jgi:alpha-glucosidase